MTVRAALLAAVAMAATATATSAPAASSCDATSFPASMNGKQTWGLNQAVNVSTVPDCVAACCAAGPAACDTYQFCPAGAACTSGNPPNSCWVGLVSSGVTRDVGGWVGGAASSAEPGLYSLTLTTPPIPVPIAPMGNGTAPDGTLFSYDSQSLRIGRSPALLAMGEMQYARQPDVANWRADLMAMKAGGLTGVGTYVFWIHHQELSNSSADWDWTGVRSLRTFVQTAGEVGLQVFVRIGPWAHGECRNGGFPDWLVKSGIPLRSMDPRFLNLTQALYEQIAAQLEGLYWKDGGPVFAVQVENEWGGSADYLLALKSIAIAAGIDVPMYTKTGWPAESQPGMDLFPFFGGYPAQFWTRDIVPTPEDDSATFMYNPIGDGGGWPVLSVEVGGGMTASYHRRIRVFPDDVGATALTQLGSGTNDLGYYIYKGATHPIGNTTMQESQITGYSNDLEVKNYDFYAPLGQFGQTHGHYHSMRRLHLFSTDPVWSPWLASMPATFPATQPANYNDTTTLRWAVRSNGNSGALFATNYQRLTTMSDIPNVRFNLTLAGSPSSPSNVLLIPAAASANLTVPAGAYFIAPFNLPAGAANLTLAYALANPLTHVVAPDGSVVLVLGAVDGIPPEFAVVGAPGVSVLSCSAGATCTAEGGNIFVRGASPGRGTVASFQCPGGATTTTTTTVSVVVLSESDSLSLYRGSLAGVPSLFLADGPVLLDPATPSTLRVRTEAPALISLSLFPAPAGGLTYQGLPVQGSPDGLFTAYSVAAPAPQVSVVSATLVQPAGPARTVPIGPAGVAQAPDQDGSMTNDFAAAAIYNISLASVGGEPFDPTTYLPRLVVNYTGDCARFLVDGVLVQDSFYNTDVVPLGLTTLSSTLFGPGTGGQGTVQLYVLPLTKGSPIYLQQWPVFPSNATSVYSLNG
jgi:beta-galactosidase